MNHELVPVFTRAKLRLTTARIEIFNALKKSDIPMTIVDLTKACPSVDKVSVYRTVQLFSDMDIISTITHGWKQSYELSSPFAPHHHHIICTSCGSITEIQSDKIEVLISELSNSNNFIPSSHHFELKGVCANCQ